jgi:hypothetical protein
MRSNEDRGGKIPFIVDVAIALALGASFIYFVVVTEYHVGAGELTHAQLLLLGTKLRTAHSTLLTGNDNKRE